MQPSPPLAGPVVNEVKQGADGYERECQPDADAEQVLSVHWSSPLGSRTVVCHLSCACQSYYPLSSGAYLAAYGLLSETSC